MTFHKLITLSSVMECFDWPGLDHLTTFETDPHRLTMWEEWFLREIWVLLLEEKEWVLSR